MIAAVYIRKVENIRLLAVCAKSILSINTEIPSVCY